MSIYALRATLIPSLAVPSPSAEAVALLDPWGANIPRRHE
jgi:hypothetical protein